MKKKLKIIIPAAVFALLIIAGCITYAVLPHKLNYNIKDIEGVGSTVEVVSKDTDEITIKKNGDGEFKVVLFTDMHLDGKNKTSYTTVDYFVKNIQREKPDLVLLAGDNVTSAFNKKRTKQLAEIFEKLGVYWGGVLGNHEGDNGFSYARDKMVDTFSSYDHCLMLRGQEDIWGDCNYCINILNDDGTLKKTFYFLDTGNDAMPGEIEKYNVTETDRHLYDGAKENQVAWYTEKAKANNEKFGKSESIMVVHIPLYQMRQAAETEKFLYGAKNEGVCSSCFDSGLFDAVKKSGTKTVYFGHDHVNNFAVELDGVTMSYLEASGYGSYNMKSKFDSPESEWLQGCTVLNIAENGGFTHEVRINHAAD
ncbi:MAG: metallophosphoesterase [Clostridia bacterium]|nr:metallophosphoesterase [Clostridia bacterium]